MNLKAALVATATAGAFLLVPACGGDAGPSQLANPSNSTQSQPAASGGSGSPARYVAIDLNSSPYLSTVGWGVANGEQVGEGVLDDYRSPCSRYVQHALLWR